MLGIAGSVAAAAVRAVVPAPDRLDGDAIADRFARAAWSCLVEPGDAVAGQLVHILGADGALRALISADGDADRGAKALLAAIAEAGEEAEVEPREVALGVSRWIGRLAAEVVLRSLSQAARFGARLLAPGDDDWPGQLADLGVHAPQALWARGDTTILGRLDRSAAIVGARAATGYGEHVAIELTGGLVDRGVAIVSGAAYGIDGAAHRAALAGGGSTVAVLAGGVDRFYPSGHETLLGRIVDRGVVVSELPCGSAPTRWRFLQRNRNIAALSAATVVVEAGWRSGSLNTAGHAASLGRPLGAIPGPVTSSASAGCHRLLRDYDAVCVTTAAEIVEMLAPADRDAARAEPGAAGRVDTVGDVGGGRGPDGARMRVLDALSVRSQRDVRAVASLSGLDQDRVRSELGLLLLEGAVREGERGWVKARGHDGGGG